MSRIPDYLQMRRMLAEVEAQSTQESEIVDILLYGCRGYIEDSKKEILEQFVELFGEHKIPKIDFNQEALKNEDQKIERGDPR